MQSSYKIYQELSDLLSHGQSAFIRTTYTGTQGNLGAMQRSLEIIPSPTNHTDKQQVLLKPVLTQNQDTFQFIEPFTPRERLMIFGGGHVGYSLYQFAVQIGFDVVIIDERPDFCNAERFPHAIQICCQGFMEAAQNLHINSYDYTVIVSQGHHSDSACLRQLLAGEKPSYLGMIGSRKKVKEVLEMLEKEGYDKDVLDQVCAPIGLNIGAATPEEIAISILAEIISYKRKPKEYSFSQNRIVNQSDVCYQTIEYLVQQTKPTPQAVITIIKNQGSSPRHAGAKMVVNKEGTILSGTIGGGRGEYLAAKAAKDIIGTGQYQVIQLDLNSHAAASNNKSICGGIIDILIEDWVQ